MSRKSPLTPLFQRGEQTTRVFSDRIVENYFFGVAMVTSPFEKGGKRGICGRYNVAAKAVLSFLLICFIVVSTVSAQTPRKIIIGVSNPDNVTFFPLYLAKDAGYFREQGLEPTTRLTKKLAKHILSAKKGPIQVQVENALK